MVQPLELPEYLRDMEIVKTLERMTRPEGMEEDSMEMSAPDESVRGL
jgi:hypothetical protein